MTYGSPPPFERLSNETYKSYLATLRNSVAPILANNLLPHFTDHSVNHSDRLTVLVDSLLMPILPSKKASDIELLILYSSCYLHDIGMQYENISGTKTFANLHLDKGWHDLPIEQKQEILRDHHNKISAEIVSTISELGSMLGIQILPEYKPEYIACLCEAHILPVESERYILLTAKQANIRLDLLSALLRVADILDESRIRTPIEKLKSLDLDIVTQTHWWRHYYTEDITIDNDKRTILLHYDFPKNHEDYSAIIPKLQLPWIQKEFSDHTGIFNEVGLGWVISSSIKVKPYTSSIEMPDAVLTEMLKQLHIQKIREADGRKQIVLESFIEAQPYIERSLEELRSKKQNILPAEYICSLWELAKLLEQLGSIRSSHMLFRSEYENMAASLSVQKRLEMGIWLAELMLRDGFTREIVQITKELNGLGEHPDCESNTRLRYYKIKAQIMFNILAFNEAISSIYNALKLSSDISETNTLNAMFNEFMFLSGDLNQIPTSTKEMKL